eukprot:3219384-Prymnesium_polylepis.1
MQRESYLGKREGGTTPQPPPGEARGDRRRGRSAGSTQGRPKRFASCTGGVQERGAAARGRISRERAAGR